MQREPDHAVVEWLDVLAAESVWVTAVTVLEIRFGFEGRVLPSTGRGPRRPG